jgi:hypothetical protein
MSADHVALTRPTVRAPQVRSLTSQHQDQFNEDNNKDTTAKGLSCQFSLIPSRQFDAYLASFQVEADPADTISNLKEKINADQGHPVESQKIIYSGNITFITQTALVLSRIIKGKVLSDDKTIESCEIKEKDFLVLMVSKVRFESPYPSCNIDRFFASLNPHLLLPQAQANRTLWGLLQRRPPLLLLRHQRPSLPPHLPFLPLRHRLSNSRGNLALPLRL